MQLGTSLVEWVQTCVSSTSELSNGSMPNVLDQTTFHELGAIAQEGSEAIATLRSGFGFLDYLFPLDKIGIGESTSFVDINHWVELRLGRLSELGSW